MAKQEKLYSSTEAAYATRLTIFSFRTKVSKLGIKGQKQGRKVYYTKKQLEDVYNGIPSKRGRALKRNPVRGKAAAKRHKK
jgi:hypothetical protein